jgi:hypothetical protein
VSFGNPFDDFMFTAVPFFVFTVFAVIIMIFLTSLAKGISQYVRNNRTPEETIPARLIAKRIHTWGGHGNMRAHTSYYATFETEKGERIEFSASGQFYGMHVEGDSGMLTYRGTRFINFERERT